jgi:hypothetical protein
MINLWRDPEAMGLPLFVLLDDAFGEEAINEWTTLTIFMEWGVEAGMEPLRAPFERLMAAVAVYRSGDFFTSPVDFSRLCLAFDGEDNAFLPDCEQAVWGMTEALMIRPQGEFSPEVKGLLGHLLDQEGILSPPDLLRIALRDRGELMARARYDFADDPEMFGAIVSYDADRTSEINDSLRFKLRRMVTQLASLPHRHDRRTEFIHKLLQKTDQMSADRPV